MQNPQHFTSVYWSNGFSTVELETIEQFGDRLMPQDAVVLDHSGTELHDRVRISRTARIPRTQETHWFYERVQGIAIALNEQFYQFDLRGFSEEFQYTVYHGSEKGHYDWHIDDGPLAVRRKFSVTLQLSDPSHYEGGELQFHAGNAVEVAPKERGAFVAFPSYVLHRVAPVTRGTRKSVVIWITGPKFK